jgi:hypothetical protein
MISMIARLDLPKADAKVCSVRLMLVLARSFHRTINPPVALELELHRPAACQAWSSEANMYDNSMSMMMSSLMSSVLLTANTKAVDWLFTTETGGIFFTLWFAAWMLFLTAKATSKRKGRK